MVISAGIDIGSVAAKAVLFDTAARVVVGSAVVPTGWDHKQAVEGVFDAALSAAGLARSDIGCTAITGYGRVVMKNQMRTVSEISCHAAGAHYLFPEAHGVIDIGGQDSKAIRFEKNGAVGDFVMNDKCAAGTGRFVQMVAALLEHDLDAFTALAAQGKPVAISSMCAVFAESEVVGLLAQGIAPQDIAAGVFASIAMRTAGLCRKLRVAGASVFTGGLAHNAVLAAFLSDELGVPLHVPKAPQITGALGAALLAQPHYITRNA